ncbi:MAG TPA: cell division/cell wall cluster transcriptional repressor MraZ, partial [Clostridiales bacterium]|nr:cell division/cell wall cluster transcriptional repressor MraZ [Clostridiales bacterium]
MFIGEYKHNIDDKNRATVPSKFRDGLGDVFVLTKGLDN